MEINNKQQSIAIRYLIQSLLAVIEYQNIALRFKLEYHSGGISFGKEKKLIWRILDRDVR